MTAVSVAAVVTGVIVRDLDDCEVVAGAAAAAGVSATVSVPGSILGTIWPLIVWIWLAG